MANMFNEDGTYNKTEWKAGDKITAAKLNKIELSLEAINNNDIDRHVEADSRLDILEERIANTPDNEQMDALEDMVKDNKDAADLAVYGINQKIESLEDEMNGAIATVEGELNGAIATVEGELNGLYAKNEELNAQLEYFINSNMVNVKMFKCDDGEYVKGDGVHDDTTGMQRAHDTGMLVEYPKGIYNFSKLLFNKGGIVGAGKSETVLRTIDISDDNIISINPTLTGGNFDTVLFENFSLYGSTYNDLYGDKINGVGIKIGSKDNEVQTYFPVIDNVHIRYIPTCIQMLNTTSFNITNCDLFFYKNKGIDYSNDLSTDAGDCGIVNNHFFNGSSLKTGIAIFQTNAGGLRITNNKINGGSNAYKCNINAVTSDLILVGNSIENCSDYSLRFSNLTNDETKITAFGNIIINGNQFALNKNDVIFEEISNYEKLSYWDCISITGNTFRHYSEGNCIELNSARNFTVSSNSFFTSLTGIIINDSCSIGEVGLNSYAYINEDKQVINNSSAVNILNIKKINDNLNENWIDLELSEGFSYYGNIKPQYRVINATVEFRGTIVASEPSTPKIVFTLPSSISDKFAPNLSFDITSPFSNSCLTYSNTTNYNKGEFNWKASQSNTFNLDIIKAYLQYY